METFNQQNLMDCVLFFGSATCGPCKALTAMVQKIENKPVPVYYADIDKNPELAMQFHVRAVPTLIAITGGSPVDQLTGFAKQSDVEQLFESVCA